MGFLATLKNVFAAATGRSAAARLERNLDLLLTAIEEDTLGAYAKTPAEICRLQGSMMTAINARAVRKKLCTMGGDGFISSFDLAALSREISGLQKLAGAVSFSDYFHRWTERNLTAVARRLAQDGTYGHKQFLWRKMDDDGRAEYLKHVSDIQTGIFSNSPLTVRPARIDFNRAAPGKAGVPINLGQFYFDGPEASNDNMPVIEIHEKVLRSPVLDPALQTVIHEHMHSTLRQAGILYAAGKIPDNHPLYDDAALMNARRANNSYIPPAYGPAYFADVEEQVCHGADRKIIPLYKSLTSPHR